MGMTDLIGPGWESSRGMTDLIGWKHCVIVVVRSQWSSKLQEWDYDRQMLRV